MKGTVFNERVVNVRPVLRKDNEQRSQCNYFSNSKLRSGLKIAWCESPDRADSEKGAVEDLTFLSIKLISFYKILTFFKKLRTSRTFYKKR